MYDINLFIFNRCTESGYSQDCNKQKLKMMKKVLFGGAVLAAIAVIFAFSPAKNAPVETAGENIKWYSWEEAIKMMESKPKKLFVDVYTDWCGWCKRMDATTFTDPEVIKYMNKNFYAVKFNAEQKEEIQYKGYTLKYLAQGRRGVHELAYSLLNGQLSYPNFVYLDEEQQVITRSPGYKTPDVLIKELQFIGSDVFKEKTYDEYLKGK